MSTIRPTVWLKDVVVATPVARHRNPAQRPPLRKQRCDTCDVQGGPVRADPEDAPLPDGLPTTDPKPVDELGRNRSAQSVSQGDQLLRTGTPLPRSPGVSDRAVDQRHQLFAFRLGHEPILAVRSRLPGSDQPESAHFGAPQFNERERDRPRDAGLPRSRPQSPRESRRRGRTGAACAPIRPRR